MVWKIDISVCKEYDHEKESLSSLRTPPNVLILLTDDQGWGDLGVNCPDKDRCPRTPHVDKFVRSNHTAWFHRFYSAASVCSPTRAALLTGRPYNTYCKSECDELGSEVNAKAALEDVGYNADLYIAIQEDNTQN